MANICLVWELGAGMAHVMQLLPFAEHFAARGHAVCAAVCKLSSAVASLGNAGAHLLQAPVHPSPGRGLGGPVSFAHVLAGTGFGGDRDLVALATAWRNLYRLTHPDVIVFDHSPVALLAARGLPAKRVVIGPGFFCPPDRAPLPPMAGRGATDEAGRAALDERLRADEAAILARVNRLLAYWKAPPLDRLSQPYADADETLLTTFRELDHYGDRGAATRYDGPVLGTGGAAPEWPAGEGPRVYAYLKPSEALQHVLGALRDRGCPTLVSPDGIPPAVRERFACATLRFDARRLDLAQVGAACDLAVLNGNHGTTCAMLLAGRPILQVPRTLEQAITARAVARLGAGVVVGGKATADQARAALDHMLGSAGFAEAARGFAARYADFDPQRQRAAMIDRVERLRLRPR